MENVLAYLVRVILIFFFTYFAARILTKKAVAQMAAYELAGVIILTTIAAEPLVTKVTTKALFGVGITASLIYITSRLATIEKLTPFLEHTPTVLVENGQLDMDSLQSSNVSLNELKGMLRAKGHNKIMDIECAVLEPQGKLSVIPKSQKRPIEPSDLNIDTQYEGLAIPLIMDGTIINKNLEYAGLDKNWLTNELEKQNITNYKTEVALAELDTSGDLLISKNKN